MSSCDFRCGAPHQLIAQRQIGYVSVNCDRMGCGVMSCVCILWQDWVPCLVSVYCDRVGCHVMCLYTVTGWSAMSCLCILWQDGVSCLVSVYCDWMGCHILCLYTVTGWGVMSYVCILRCGGVMSCQVYVYCDGMVWHALCLRHDIPVWQHIEWSKYQCYKQTTLRYDFLFWKTSRFVG